MTGDELRRAFLTFFEGKGHTIIPSSSLVPHGDPTLLLTTAGMVQIKPYFLGLAAPPNRRLASCQKCFRTTDIDSVGDAKHLTFFEMLGNFSVGDYFKKEAIDWAWEYVTQWLRLPSDRLWITIFLDDDEAFGHWREAGVAADRIVRLGEEYNYWGPAGDSGPCGPCSEIHYDFGAKVGCGQPDCGPACNCDRFSEIWNLVFTQYDQDKEGRRTPLPRPNIDTGMGLERIAAVVQGKLSVYETDLFAPILARVTGISGKRLGVDQGTDRAAKIIAEHIRGITFLMADGVVPGNEGRGYVLRRLLRRTALFGRKLALEEPFLVDLADCVIEKMGHVYPELRANRELVSNAIAMEEKRFGQVVDAGIGHLDAVLADMVENVRRQLVDPNVAAILAEAQRIAQQFGPDPRVLQALQQHQHTLGQLEKTVKQFRPDPNLLQTLLRQQEVLSQFQRTAQQLWQTIPLETIKRYQESASQVQKALEGVNANASLMRALEQVKIKPFMIPGREAFRLYDTYGFPKELTEEIAGELGFHVDSAEFESEMDQQKERARAAAKFNSESGAEARTYEQWETSSCHFVGHDQWKHRSEVAGLLVHGAPVDTASAGEDVEVILRETPFYGEMGGQVGDAGEIRAEHGSVLVRRTTRPLPDLVVHQGRVAQGRIKINDAVEAEVDLPRRLDIARNHTATHLLHAALRKVLGPHVRQSGSLVNADGFRFDFTSPEPVGKQRLLEIRQLVNEKIRENLPVLIRSMPYGEAVSRGAMALFGEKYGDVVRVVETGDPPFSIELCGGTHVRSTGEIGILHIVSEASIGSGLRRIEALTGRGAERFLAQRSAVVEALAQEFQTSPDNVQSKVLAVLAELGSESKRASQMERELARRAAGSLLSKVEEVKGIKVLSTRVSAASSEAMREMGDRLKAELRSGVIVLGAVLNGSPVSMAMVTPDLVAKGLHAGRIVKEVSKITGGGGGGKAEFGQGSGKDAAKLDEALKQVRHLVELQCDRDSGKGRKSIG